MHPTENPELRKILQAKESLTHSKHALNVGYHTAFLSAVTHVRTKEQMVQLLNYNPED